MLDLLDRKVRQIHAALGGLDVGDPSQVQPEIKFASTGIAIKLDYGAGADPIKLANAASLLIANIASIKDHLKAWCRSTGVPFNGDKLIDSNRSVALIHDLWNVDKHAFLSSSPRSGHTPKLSNVRQALRLSVGSQAGSKVITKMDPRTGRLITVCSNGSSAKLTLVASIVEESGTVLGDFGKTCEEAVAAWEIELRAAGVPLQ